MGEAVRKEEWLRYIKASPTRLKINALRAVLENDGEEMLRKCLKELGWLHSVDLIKQVEAPELVR